MRAMRPLAGLLVLAVAAVVAACGSAGGALLGPAPTELRLGEATLVTEGTAYAIATTGIAIVPQMFTPLDTPAGHVLTGRLTVSDDALSEPLTLHASAVEPFPRPPTEWHGLLFQLSETGFVYGGHSATLTVTRAP